MEQSPDTKAEGEELLRQIAEDVDRLTAIVKAQTPDPVGHLRVPFKVMQRMVDVIAKMHKTGFLQNFASNDWAFIIIPKNTEGFPVEVMQTIRDHCEFIFNREMDSFRDRVKHRMQVDRLEIHDGQYTDKMIAHEDEFIKRSEDE